MRCIAFIMAVLVLALSFFPCEEADINAEGSMQHREVYHNAAKKTTAPDDHGGDHKDNCSPFCHCSCCAGFSMNHQLAELTTNLAPYNPAYASHYLMAVREVSIPIWQPPQLS